MISGRGKRDQKKGCVSEIHGRRASGYSLCPWRFPTTFLFFAHHYSFRAVLLNAVFRGREVHATVFNCASCSVCELFEVFFPVLSSGFFSPSCVLTRNSFVREGGLLPASARRDHCWSPCPYFGEKVKYASLCVYIFFGPSRWSSGGRQGASSCFSTCNSSFSCTEASALRSRCTLDEVFPFWAHWGASFLLPCLCLFQGGGLACLLWVLFGSVFLRGWVKLFLVEKLQAAQCRSALAEAQSRCFSIG